jgi:hypothetical protein
MANGVELDFHRKMCAPSTKEKVRISGLTDGLAICPIICAARVFSLSYRRCTQLVGAATSAWPLPTEKIAIFQYHVLYTSQVTARKEQLIDFSRDFFSLPQRHYNCQQYITFNHFLLFMNYVQNEQDFQQAMCSLNRLEYTYN